MTSAAHPRLREFLFRLPFISWVFGVSFLLVPMKHAKFGEYRLHVLIAMLLLYSSFAAQYVTAILKMRKNPENSDTLRDSCIYLILGTLGLFVIVAFILC